MRWAARHDADADALLGLVIAHELGHLLLGPGYVDDGVMRAAWKKDELEALRQRRLRFTKSQRERIQQELRARAELVAGQVKRGPFCRCVNPHASFPAPRARSCPWWIELVENSR